MGSQRVLGEGEVQRPGLGELGGRPEAPVVGVEGTLERRPRHLDGMHRRSGAQHRLARLLSLMGRDAPMDLLALLGVGRGHMEQYLSHLLRGEVGGPIQHVPRGGQNRRGRPAPLVVAVVDVREPVGVHSHRDVSPCDQLHDIGVLVGGLIHHVAPVAPVTEDVQQDRLVLPLRQGEGFVTPL